MQQRILTMFLTAAVLEMTPSTGLCQCQTPVFDEAQEVMALGAHPTVRSVADVNADGFPDLLVSRTWGSTSFRYLCLLLGRGDGTFDGALNFGDDGAYDGELAELNGDGSPDLVMIENAESRRVTIRLNDGAGHFAEPMEYTGPWDWLNAVYVADVNGDGMPDVLYEPLFETLRVRMNLGGGAMGPEIETAVSLSEEPILLHDLTGDGRAEIILNQHFGGLRYFADDGSGTYPAEHALLPEWASQLQLVDVDGDGSLDLGFQRTVGSVIHHETWLNDGSGHFTPTAPIIAPSSSRAYTDLDGDRDLDLILCSSGVAAVYLNTGGATFTGPSSFPFPGNTACFAADQNGDGLTDLVGFRSGGFSFGDVVVLLGLGGGDFGSPSTHVCQASPNARIAALADLDRNGLLDVIVSTYRSGPVSDSGELKAMTAQCACPADFNSDDVANSQDFFDFLATFFSNDPAADFNHDGAVNSQDFFDFLAAFIAGCQ